MASPGTKVIQGKYISAWGGIQSAGQTIGQIVSLPPRRPRAPFGLKISIPGPAVCHRCVWSETCTPDPLGVPRGGKFMCLNLSPPWLGFANFTVSSEHFCRVFRHALGPLARGQALFRHRRGHASGHHASVSLGDRTHPVEGISHQRLQLVSFDCTSLSPSCGPL